jgi:hypothetical protein
MIPRDPVSVRGSQSSQVVIVLVKELMPRPRERQVQ